MNIQIFSIIVILLVIVIPLITGICEVKANKSSKILNKVIDVEVTDPNDIEMVINLKDKQDIYNDQILQMIENIKFLEMDLDENIKYIEMAEEQLNNIIDTMPRINTSAITSVYKHDIINKKKYINKIEMDISKLKNKIIDNKMKSDVITNKLEEIGMKYL